MHRYFCILPHPGEPRVLLIPGEEGWSLPVVETEGGWFAHCACSVARRLSEQLELKVTALRHIRHAEIDFCELENHSPRWIPPEHWRWVGARDLDDLTFAVPEQRVVIQSWLDEAERGAIPARRPPWERRGWFSEASAWIERQLKALGYTAAGPVKQIKAAGGPSSILRVRTTAGHLYFKADFAKPPAEPPLILALAARWPQNVPAILAADIERRWMLMRDFGDADLDGQSLHPCQEAVRLFAMLQIDSAARLDRWFALGCPDFRPEVLPAYLHRMLSDPTATRPGTTHDLDETEIERLRARVPRLAAMCAQLEEYGLPPSLVQQDFRHGNIVLQGSTYLFYDWSDTVIGHPFFSPVRFLEYIWLPEGEDPRGEACHQQTEARRLAISDAYLEPWTIYQPMERLRETFALARRLNALYQAIRWYHDAQYLEITAPWGQEIVSGLPGSLRNLLTLEG